MKIHNYSSEVSIWLKEVNVFTKDFYYSQLGIYILKMDLSNWDLDYMIPKGTSHTSAPDSTYEVQKIEIKSYKEKY